MAIKGELTLDSEHTKQYINNKFIELYIKNLFNFTNQFHPDKFNKK